MTSKHYRWQTNWRVDLANGTATHVDGLVFDFSPCAAGQRVQSGSAHYTSASGARYIGTLRGGDGQLRAWIAGQPNLRDPGSQQSRVARLLREAGAVYGEALQV